MQPFLNQIITIKVLLLLLVATILSGCGAQRFRKTQHSVLSKLEGNALSNQFTGFLVVDLSKNDTLFNVNGQKYFTPASTTKLFTFYAALKTLGEKSPLLKFHKDNDTLFISGTGNPAPFHPYFKDSLLLSFLRNHSHVVLQTGNYAGQPLGPGWAWEDYPYYFSPEMTALPLYGNVVTISPGNSLTVRPKTFAQNLNRSSDYPARAWKSNQFYVEEALQDTLEIPFITSDSLTVRMLQAVTDSNIGLSDGRYTPTDSTLYGIATDSILKRMLFKSDNFLAEQTMLMVSATLSDTLDFAKARDYVLENHLPYLQQAPRWVDGSGLSRYNLFTPESMVALLRKLYQETDTSRLFRLLPRWNSEGTLGEDEAGYTNAFLFAKSGSMGNVYNLCGYLRTQSGQLLAFSFMNNHFRRPAAEVRMQLFQVLKAIHEGY